MYVVSVPRFAMRWGATPRDSDSINSRFRHSAQTSRPAAIARLQAPARRAAVLDPSPRRLNRTRLRSASIWRCRWPHALNTRKQCWSPRYFVSSRSSSRRSAIAVFSRIFRDVRATRNLVSNCFAGITIGFGFQPFGSLQFHSQFGFLASQQQKSEFGSVFCKPNRKFVTALIRHQSDCSFSFLCRQ